MTSDELNNLLQVTKDESQKRLEDGTIIKTTVYTYPNRVTTTVDTITPEMQQKTVAETESKIAELQATIAPIKENLLVKTIVK